MKGAIGVIIAICLIYLCVVQTAQLFAIIKAADFAQQELSSQD
jgi:hypothetical protein